jgi:hypothetical protein
VGMLSVAMNRGLNRNRNGSRSANSGLGEPKHEAIASISKLSIQRIGHEGDRHPDCCIPRCCAQRQPFRFVNIHKIPSPPPGTSTYAQ